MKNPLFSFAMRLIPAFLAVFFPAPACAQNLTIEPYKYSPGIGLWYFVPHGEANGLSPDFAKLMAKARQDGSVKVIAGFRLSQYQPDATLPGVGQTLQRGEIKQKQSLILSGLSDLGIKNAKEFDYIPFLALEVSAEALEFLRDSGEVESLQEDEAQSPSLIQSIPLIGGSAPGGATGGTFGGFSGSGRTVAILDTGIDKTHAFFNSRVVSEACYSTNGATSTSFCPGGAASSTAADSGLNCSVSQITACKHGTHVAGIAAGGHPSITGNGVARNANIIAIQVFSRSTDCAPNPSPCAVSFTSDAILGLERVYALRSNYSIDAVNLSLGSGQYTASCDSEQAAYKAAIDNLRSGGIASVAAAGNNGFTGALSSPACISTAIAVSSTNDGSTGSADTISSFSNRSSQLSLFAPGETLISAVPGGAFEEILGTSQAAAHVAGAFAVVRQKFPSDTVPQVLTRLKYSGVRIIDAGGGVIKPRLKLDTALNTSNIDPCNNSQLIISGQTINASIAAVDCLTSLGFRSDAYRFSATQGQTVAISQTSTAVDSYLFLVNSSGAIIAQDDNGGGGTNARIPSGTGSFTIPASGIYTIFAAARQNGTGNYGVTLTGTATARQVLDFDGDGKTDISIFRPSVGEWYYLSSLTGNSPGAQFGASSDKIAPADYTGDGKADFAFFRPSDANWYIIRSENSTFFAFPYGANGDIPAPGDFDGDGKADVTIFRPSLGLWASLRSSDNQSTILQFGANGDIPVVADYDGDGKSDFSVYRPSAGEWYTRRSSNGSVFGAPFGAVGDKPVQGDYTGDGKADFAIFRPSTGFWYVLRSEDQSFFGSPFGVATDTPTIGDYDGDGKNDFAVFRPSTGNWFIQRSTAGFLAATFGVATDRPAPAYYLP